MALNEQKVDDEPFAMPSGRLRAPLVSVMEPSVDFKSSQDGKRLENVGEFDAETWVRPRTKAPVPRDDEFVSTFRRPLVSAESDDGDPLGKAAPDVDISEVKAAVAEDSQRSKSQTSTSRSVDSKNALEDSENYIVGTELRFPKLSRRQPPAATTPASITKRPTDIAPQKRATRRSKGFERPHEDLTDLVKPVHRVGELEIPQSESSGKDSDLRRGPLSESGARDKRNTAMAMQQLLGRRLKKDNFEKWRR